MRLRRVCGLAGLLVALGLNAARAQVLPLGTPLSPAASISLITVAPGTPVYSRFGHTGIRVQDPALGLDVLYNYGTFRFDQWFIFRFAYGAMDYELSVAPFDRALEFYRDVEHRSVVEQGLRLSPAQVQTLFAALETNLLPENATYRYDFLFDNCATRPRDILERALGSALVRPNARPSGHTFRGLIDPYVTGAPLVDLGVSLGMGMPVDRPASGRQATFLPDSLLAYVAATRVQTPAGPAPLVVRTDTLVRGTPFARRALPWPALLIGLLSAWGALLTVRDAVARRFRRRKWLDRLVFGIAGVAGVVLAFLSFVSVHTVTFPNVHLLWAFPTHLALAASSGRSRALRRYAWLALAGAGAFLLFWSVLPQRLPFAVFPFVALLALRALVRAWRPGADD